MKAAAIALAMLVIPASTDRAPAPESQPPEATAPRAPAPQTDPVLTQPRAEAPQAPATTALTIPMRRIRQHRTCDR